MKTLLISSLLLPLALLSGCNSANNNNSATTRSDTENEEPLVDYDPAMDLTLTGGDSIEMLGDTLGIKMYTSTIAPGDSVALHSHPDHTVYILEGGTLAVYFDGTNKKIMELPDGAGFISPPLSDAAVNVGETTIKLLTHDIYRPR